MPLILRGIKGSKLTIEETDSNFTYLEELAQSGGSGLVELTYSEVLDLLDSGGIVDGTRYLVTGVDVELYGGTSVLVTGLPDNQLSQNGWGKFYNARYDIIYVWDPIATYSVDDLVIYGGKVWKNLTGSVGSSTDVFILDNTNWELQEDYTNTAHYATVWDQIEVGYGDGAYRINSRYDSFRNNYVRVGQLDSYSNDRWFFCGVNPLQVFAWGNDNINDCNIIDSYFNCLNVIGNTTIYGFDMSNYSFIFDSMLRDVYIEGISFKNESGSYELYMNNCYFRYCKLENNSFIVGDFELSTIENLNLSNESYISNTNFYNSSLANINLNNNSYVNSITASASYFQHVDMTNNSYIENIDLSVGLASNSYFQRSKLSNRSYISNIDLYDSTMYELTLDNYSYIDGSMDLWNSSMNYIKLDNHSRISGNIGLSSSYFKRIDMTNRSRIQGNITLNNSHFEKIDMTNDGYISNINMNDSYFEDLDFKSSNLQNISLTASSINTISLNDSNLSSIGLSNSSIYNINSYGSDLNTFNFNNSSLSYLVSNNSVFQNLQLEDSSLFQYNINSTYFNLSSLGTQSSFLPDGSLLNFNEFKYQFSLTFNGATGFGKTDAILNIPVMLVPQDFYIDKVVIESSSLSYSGSPATFSFGILGLSPSNIEIGVDNISSSLNTFSLLNESIIWNKNLTDTRITSYLTGGTDITSGGIKVEVTIKNTNYYAA